MQLLNPTIDRIIIHQIFQRDSDGNKVRPIQSHEYTNFDSSAMDAFKSRVQDALGDGSKAVMMEVVNQEPKDLPSLINNMITQDDDSFAVSSFDVAVKLTEAQQRKAIPGGIVAVFSGKYGVKKRSFIGIIKAEIHNGYEKVINEGTKEISLKFVEEVLLTPGTKLYKTAGFFERDEYDNEKQDLSEKWIVMVSDSQINKADGKAAAQYFYADFLGCGYPETSARTTKKFYESASEFIADLDVSQSQKIDLMNALVSYVKVNNSSIVSVSEFASTYFDIDTQDLFLEYMDEAGVPNTAFTKDLEHIQTKLKLRRVKFGRNVNITAPLDVFQELIDIETIDGDLDESGAPTEWTRITVKDRISSQE